MSLNKSLFVTLALRFKQDDPENWVEALAELGAMPIPEPRIITDGDIDLMVRELWGPTV